MAVPNDAGRPAGRLTPEELQELTQQMLRNLQDPDVAKEVDAAEEQLEKEMREAFSRLMERKEKSRVRDAQR
jgi:hypothetical protein